MNIEDVRVHNEQAIRCSIVSKPVNIIEYVKAVSSAIGASHILAVFEERDSVKIYLNDKRFVDTLMRSCLHVMGRHVKVDYASPPGTRLVLTDVDPIVSNYDVMRLLSVYGTVVSPVIRPPISDDIELCHIGYGVRYVYMNFATECGVPEKVEFKYGEQIQSFKVHIETADIIVLSNLKVDIHDDGMQENENSNSSIISQDVSSPPILVSVQSISSNIQEECVSPPKIANSDAGMEQGSSATKRRGRPPSPLKRMRMAKKITATSKIARKIKRNVKHKWIRRRYRRGKVIAKQTVKSTTLEDRTVRNPSDSSSTSTNPESSMVLVEAKEEDVTTEVLSKERLLEFLHQIKNNRAPLEFARKYLGDDSESTMNDFINQLQTFRKQETDLALKTRIWRLIKSLKEQLNMSNQSISSEIMD